MIAMASVKKCKHCGKDISDEEMTLGYGDVCSKCVFDIIWDLNKHHTTMDEKRKCKVCKEEKSVASFGLGGSNICLACKTRKAAYCSPMSSDKRWHLKK